MYPKINAAYNHFGKNEGQLIVLNNYHDGTADLVDEFDKKHTVIYPSIAGKDGGEAIMLEKFVVQLMPSIRLVIPDKKVITIDPYKNVIDQVEKYVQPTENISPHSTYLNPQATLSSIHLYAHSIQLYSDKMQSIFVCEYSLNGQIVFSCDNVQLLKGYNTVTWPFGTGTRGVRILQLVPKGSAGNGISKLIIRHSHPKP